MATAPSFDDVYVEDLPAAWRVVAARIPDRQEAEDVTSDVFVRALQSWPVAALRTGALTRTWAWLGLLGAAAGFVEIFASIDPAPQILLMMWAFWVGAILLTTPEERRITNATRSAVIG